MRKPLSSIKLYLGGLAGILAIYGVLLIFPQTLFANKIFYKNFEIYTRQPVNENIYKVLDSAESKLENSPLYDGNLKPKIYLTDSFPLYTFLNPRGHGSLANTTVGIGVIVNKTDVAGNRVFRDAAEDNQRPLSDVIAHEITHLLMVNHFGVLRTLSLPSWKVEGYCEYVAGNTTIGDTEGLRRWRANPNDASTYLYFKYQQEVKYLLDDEKISVDDLFTKDFDEHELNAKVFTKIKEN